MRLRCERVVHGGLCVAHADGGATVLVAGAIPGEAVDVLLRYRKKNTWFGDVVSAAEASPHRVPAPCRYVPECGGCQLQHVAYQHQLQLKREIVLDALRRQRVPLDCDVRVCGMDEPWRYRQRGEFHVVRDGDRVGLGFNRARSWRPVAVDDCLIHDAAITCALPELRRMVDEGGSPSLTALHVTLGEEGTELLMRAKPRRALDADAVDAAALRMPGETRLVTDSTTVRWRGHSFRVSPGAFMQVNVAQLEALYGAALHGLSAEAGQRVVDAYAGVGMLAVEVATAGAVVTCIESNRESARLGVLNARLNGVEERVRYVAAAAEEALPTAGDVDRLLLDPPRAGCDGRVTGWLALAGPERVVYVSCDPATLARDLHVLVASGPYTVTETAIVDMFPQTYHVEVVATLARA